MIIDIINKKRLGKELTKEELMFAFDGYLKKKVKDYQMSSLLMAICINGMSDSEIFDLCDIFIESGDILDLSDIPGIKVDKHSTGGVGDKTTLVVAPIVASLGVPVVKMSGRGLGYTGGTIDKLESIPGFRTDLTLKQIKDQVKNIGMVITSQTENLTPIDKEIYALRDVTGTTESIPLIAGSIMSKNIAIKVEDKVYDLSEEINYKNNCQYVTINDDEGVKILRHSLAHVMAAALQKMDPNIQFAIIVQIAPCVYCPPFSLVPGIYDFIYPGFNLLFSNGGSNIFITPISLSIK